MDPNPKRVKLCKNRKGHRILCVPKHIPGHARRASTTDMNEIIRAAMHPGSAEPPAQPNVPSQIVAQPAAAAVAAHAFMAPQSGAPAVGLAAGSQGVPQQPGVAPASPGGHVIRLGPGYKAVPYISLWGFLIWLFVI